MKEARMLSLRMPESQIKTLERWARKDGIGVSEYIRRLISRHIRGRRAQGGDRG